MKKCAIILLLLITVVFLQAQDYQISFAGIGASTNVDSVIIENLTKGKSISVLGSESLHLVGTITGFDPTINHADNSMRLFPNPMTDICRIDFVAQASGLSTIELFDIAGKRIGIAKKVLTIGSHSYQVNGLENGIYSVRISSQRYSYTGKLVSIGTQNSDVKINYLGNSVFPNKTKKLKSGRVEKIMQYTNGDRLKFKGTSGNYSTIVTDIPTQSKTLTFTFVACTDVDGNYYPIVQIGTQIWMAENLKTTKYRNGDNITTTSLHADMVNELNPQHRWSFNNNDSFVPTYGLLYTWYALSDNRGICPVGWHVPTETEWTTLINYLGGKNEAGGKLKETGTIHWNNPNIEATNESGFTALPCGFRSHNDFQKIYYQSCWWSSTESSSHYAKYIYVLSSSSELGKSSTNEFEGYSIRCIKD